MRVVIAPDKFRGSMTAIEAARAIGRGVLEVVPGVEVDLAPMADGGEGTVEALVAATGGRLVEREVTGPLGKPVLARYGLLGDGQTAVIEMAAASGLGLIGREERDPLRATTRGTGELMVAAVEGGARRLIVGIGGSATNDGGAGMAQALGYRLLDSQGQELEPGGGALGGLEHIDCGRVSPLLRGIEVIVACDVDNPLCGERGAARVFGPQKGASAEDVATLDANLDHWATIIERDLGVSIRDLAGAGAAGGLGGGLVAFAGGRLRRGVEIVIDAVGLAGRVAGADLVITGEGKLDNQSEGGKTVAGVAALARSLGKPALLLAGVIDGRALPFVRQHFVAWDALRDHAGSDQESLDRAASLLERAAARTLAAWLKQGAHPAR